MGSNVMQEYAACVRALCEAKYVNLRRDPEENECHGKRNQSLSSGSIRGEEENLRRTIESVPKKKKMKGSRTRQGRSH
jgi:hypothetical protein